MLVIVLSVACPSNPHLTDFVFFFGVVQILGPPSVNLPDTQRLVFLTLLRNFWAECGWYVSFLWNEGPCLVGYNYAQFQGRVLKTLGNISFTRGGSREVTSKYSQNTVHAEQVLVKFARTRGKRV